jgi:hypothetical protein
MSTPTFEKFNYALRPAKNIERKMICEGLSRIARIASPKTYRYIGFGGVGFVDFAILHQRLGVKDMISIEIEEAAKPRIEFNRPYSCIRMKWGSSHDVLPILKWKKRCITWLDYDKHINAKMLSDIALCTSAMRSGSAIIVTVNADPGEIETDVNLAAKRLNDLRARLGKNKLRLSIVGTDLAGWGLANVCRMVVVDEIARILKQRNGPLPKDQHLIFHQTFNFRYRDGVRMMTIGGFFLNESDYKKLRPDYYKDLAFYKNGDDAYSIEVPVLTLREIKHLDERLPRIQKRGSGPDWIPSIERKKYAEIYRYFPAYSEIES